MRLAAGSGLGRLVGTFGATLRADARRWLAACAVLAAFAAAAPAGAAEFTAACTGTDGDEASLRQQIADANSTAGDDTVVLGAGCLYSFTDANNHWYGPNALPPIASTMAIRGGAAARGACAHGAGVVQSSGAGRALLNTGLGVICPPHLPRNCGGSGRITTKVNSAKAAGRRSYVVAKLGFAVRSGHTRVIRIRMTPRGQRILRRLKRLRVSVGLINRGSGGARVKTDRSATVRLR